MKINLFQKDDAAERSIKLCEELDRLKAQTPAVLAEFDRGAKALEPLAQEWRLANDTGSRHEPELRERLRAGREQNRLKTIIQHNTKIAAATSELEHLTANEIAKFRQRCRNLRDEFQKQRQGDSQGTEYNPVRDGKLVTYPNNHRAVSQAIKLADEAEREIAGMKLRPIPEIRAAIAEWEKRFAEINTDVFESDQISPSLAADLRMGAR
jgi:hypothetical protein